MQAHIEVQKHEDPKAVFLAWAQNSHVMKSVTTNPSMP